MSLAGHRDVKQVYHSPLILRQDPYRHIGCWRLSAVVKKATESCRTTLPGRPETLFSRESANIQRTIGLQCAEQVCKLLFCLHLVANMCRQAQGYVFSKGLPRSSHPPTFASGGILRGITMQKRTSERTSDVLKGAMWDELEALTRGESTPQNARAKAALSSQICAITRLEMDFSRFVIDARAVDGRLGQIPMGQLT